MLALREDPDFDTIPNRSFEQALKEVRASVTEDMLRDYERIAERLRTEDAHLQQRIGFEVPAEP